MVQSSFIIKVNNFFHLAYGIDLLNRGHFLKRKFNLTTYYT